MTVPQLCLNTVTGSLTCEESLPGMTHNTPQDLALPFSSGLSPTTLPCLAILKYLKCPEWVYFSDVCLFITNSTLPASGIEQTCFKFWLCYDQRWDWGMSLNLNSFINKKRIIQECCENSIKFQPKLLVACTEMFTFQDTSFIMKLCLILDWDRVKHSLLPTSRHSIHVSVCSSTYPICYYFVNVSPKAVSSLKLGTLP